MAKKTESGAELRKLAEESELVYGKDRTLNGLRDGTIQKVFLADNCEETTRNDILHYCSVGNIECVELDLTSEEIGTLCRKQFMISVVGVPRGSNESSS